MSTNSTAQHIEEALGIVSRLSGKAAQVVTEQLEYLKAVQQRDGNLRAVPKNKMTIGVIAAREYDTTEPKLAELLYKIDWALDHDL